MRLKDENKRHAIYQAAMEVITTDGLAGSSLSKIAKLAGVSSSTIYVYFENKEDMLNKLYLMTKETSGPVLFDDIDDSVPVREGLERFMRNLFKYMSENPVVFSFHEQFYHSPGITRETREAGNRYYAPLFELYHRGLKEKSIKPHSPELLAAFILPPVMDLVHAHLSGEQKVTESVIKKAVEMGWDAVSL